MNRDDIIRMALEAEFTGFDSKCDRLHHFANLVAAAAYEECAQICDAYGMPDGTSETAAILARAIRVKRKMTGE